MSVANSVRRHIRDMPDERIFTTRDLLCLTTSRGALDVAIFRLVEKGEIRRLARGVFIKNLLNQREPSIEEIAMVKASSFGKMIYQHGLNAASEIGFLSKKVFELTKYYFYTTGCSSSFQAGDTTVFFKSVSKRKTSITNSQSGKLLKSLWNQGEHKANGLRNQAMFLKGKLDSLEKVAFQQEIRVMPIWLVQLFYPRSKKGRKLVLNVS